MGPHPNSSRGIEEKNIRGFLHAGYIDSKIKTQQNHIHNLPGFNGYKIYTEKKEGNRCNVENLQLL